MKYTRIILFFLLAIYSIALFWIDVQWGQDQVRGFFSDIITGTDHPLVYRAFFGINTTLVVLMLTGSALLFFVCIGCSPQQSIKRKTLLFQSSQVLFFLYLACDERLLIHEKLASIFGFEDSFFILGLGLVELALLIFMGEVMKQSWKIKGWLFSVCLFFGLMVLVDMFLPERMSGRLALEDLSKIWAVAFLFTYAWQYGMDWIAGLWTKECDGA